MQIKSFVLTLLLLVSKANATEFTSSIPRCNNATTPAIPSAYLERGRRDGRFAWAVHVSPKEDEVAGGGEARADERSLDWYDFLRVDLNNDGYCDWYLTMAAPVSSGGDRDTLNTLYLGSPQGWKRIGASIPKGQIDELGVGRTYYEQSNYSFGEEIGVLHENSSDTNYIIASFSDRNTEFLLSPGYRIYTWNSAAGTITEQDKWEPGSMASMAYEFFKKHGAWVPGDDSPVEFDPDIEANEFKQACNKNTPFAEHGEASKYLLERCGPAPASNGQNR